MRFRGNFWGQNIYVKNNDNQLIYRYKNDESVKC